MILISPLAIYLSIGVIYAVYEINLLIDSIKLKEEGIDTKMSQSYFKLRESLSHNMIVFLIFITDVFLYPLALLNKVFKFI